MSARTEKKIFLKIRKTRHFYQKIPGPLPVTFPSSRRGENIPNNEPKKFEINCTKIEWKLFPTHLESHILPSPLRKTLFYGKSTTFPYATCFSWFGFCEPIYIFFLFLFISFFVILSYVYDESWIELTQEEKIMDRYFNGVFLVELYWLYQIEKDRWYNKHSIRFYKSVILASLYHAASQYFFASRGNNLSTLNKVFKVIVV